MSDVIAKLEKAREAVRKLEEEAANEIAEARRIGTQVIGDLVAEAINDDDDLRTKVAELIASNSGNLNEIEAAALKLAYGFEVSKKRKYTRKAAPQAAPIGDIKAGVISSLQDAAKG